MLPDVSRRITAANGVSSAEKNSIFCSTPSLENGETVSLQSGHGMAIKVGDSRVEYNKVRLNTYDLVIVLCVDLCECRKGD
jgi:hypothetical protein